MAINVVCSCGKTYVLDGTMAGRKARCGKCGFLMSIPVFVPSLNIELEVLPIASKAVRRSTNGLYRWVGCVVVSMLIGAGIGTTIVKRGDVKPWPQAFAQAFPVAVDPPRVPAAKPLKPAQQTVLDHLKKFSPDPSAVEVIEWWEPVPADCTMATAQYDTAVYLVMRGRNALGTIGVGAGIAFLDKGRVSAIVTRSDYRDTITWQMELARLYNLPIKAPLNDMMHEMIKAGPR